MKINNAEFKQVLASELIELKILKPEIQRIVEPLKVEEIIQYQLDFYKKHNHFNFMASGPICNIHYLEDNYFLIDGQHRFEALKDLYNNKGHNISVCVLFVKVESIEELNDNYFMINNNTSLPDFTSYFSINKKIPEQVAQEIQTEYRTVWSQKPRAYRPNLYFNYFQDSLAFICEKLPTITTADDLKNKIYEYNKILAARPKDKFKVSDKIYNKARESGLYLGLLKYESGEPGDYGYIWAKEIVEYYSGERIKKTIKNKKKSVPKKLKSDIWDKYIGNKIGEVYCICCNKNKICQANFHAGHIISEKNGGSININNIIPICNLCNQSMSTKNMDEYIKEYYPDNIGAFINKQYSEEENINNKGFFNTILSF